MAGRRNPIDSALLVAMVLVLAALAWGTWRDESFWQTPDQRAYDDYLAQDYSSAEARFQNLQWKASACYRRGDFSDRKSTRLNSSHLRLSRMPSSA